MTSLSFELILFTQVPNSKNICSWHFEGESNALKWIAIEEIKFFLMNRLYLTVNHDSFPNYFHLNSFDKLTRVPNSWNILWWLCKSLKRIEMKLGKMFKSFAETTLSLFIGVEIDPDAFFHTQITGSLPDQV